jgi:hypothetical protein
MKYLSSLWNRNLIMAAAFALALTPQIAKAQGKQCVQQNAIMNGTYVMTASGSITGFGAYASVAEVIYDGQGNGLIVALTESINGAIDRQQGTTGVYTVNADCTGNKTFGAGASAQHFDFVITPDGSTITWISTGPGATIIGTAVRMKH